MKKYLNLKLNAKELLFINLGLLIQSLGIYFFLIKSNMVIGGLTGIGIIVNTLFPNLPVGAFMLGANIILIIIGYMVLGNNFGTKTIYCSFMLSGLIWLYEIIFVDVNLISENELAVLAMASIFIGTGAALIFNQNASTGGIDIIAKILSKYYSFNMGKSMLIVDFFVAFASSFVLGIEKAMFALLGIIIISFFIDNISEGLTRKKQVTIVSNNIEEIRTFIIKYVDRGATIYKAIGGYSNKDNYVLMSIMNHHQFVILKTHLKKIDPNAFVIVNNVNEIIGTGFNNIEI